jgi:3-oxoacyl-[acyl-carrier-protein] synthase II
MTVVKRRVVITGIGVVCPLGSTKEALWEGLASGRSGVSLLEPGPSGPLPVQFGAEVKQFQTDEIEGFGPLEKDRKKAIRKALKMMCRECQMGVAAAQLAIGDSRLSPGQVEPERIGINFGSEYVPSIPEEFIEAIKQCQDEQGRFQFSRWGGEGLPKMSPLWLLKYLPNMPASHLAIFNDFRGPNNSITQREAAANLAFTEAHEIIVRGNADAMVVGANGTRLHSMKLFQDLSHTEIADGLFEPAQASRPFDRDRCGMVLGEGAGAVVLEELSSAEKRGAAIIGESIAGSSSSVMESDASASRRKAMVNVLRGVLQKSNLEAGEIGHLHAHGLSARVEDVEEAQAIDAVFGRRSRPLPVVAAKSYFGNLGAGGGIIELIASILALNDGRLFPILNYATPDPQCPVNAVADRETPSGDSCVNLSVTPQGQASAVLVRRFER